MSRPTLPRGLRKFIRKEKARIRATTPDHTEAERLVRELMQRYRGVAERATVDPSSVHGRTAESNGHK